MSAIESVIADYCGWIADHHYAGGEQKEEVDLGDPVHLEQLEVEL